jgi:hypothetical protein
MWKFILNFIPGIGPALSAAWGFVTDHWQFFAVAIMIGMLAYQNFSVTRFVFGLPTIPHLEQQVAADQVVIKKLNSDLDVATTANAKLTADIQTQNKTIKEWADISQKLKEQNAKLQGTLDGMRVATDRNVNAILNSQTPATCEASIQYLRDMKHNLVW